MNVQYDLVVDFARPSKSNTIIVSEYDNNSRVCHFTLLSDKKPFSMADVTNAYITATRPDGTIIIDTANVDIVEDEEGNLINEIMYTIPVDLTNTAGNIIMQITLMAFDEGALKKERITSFEFYLLVRNGLYTENDMVDQQTVQGFQELLNQCLETLSELKEYSKEATRPNPYPISITVEDETVNYTGDKSAEIKIVDVAYIANDIVVETESLDSSSVKQCRDYAAQCQEAAAVAEEGRRVSEKALEAKDTVERLSLETEGYSVGTQNGEEVTDESPYFHNNAKYYAEQAQGGVARWETTIGKPFESIGSNLSVDEQGRLNAAKNEYLRYLEDVSINNMEKGDILQAIGQDAHGNILWSNSKIESPVIRMISFEGESLNSILHRLAEGVNESQTILKPGTNIRFLNGYINAITNVQCDSYLSDGIPIARMTIDGNSEEIYAPLSSKVEWEQDQKSGDVIAHITIDGETTDVFAPKLQAGDGITIEHNVISATGGGSTTEYGTLEEFEAEKDSFPIGTEYLITDDFEEGGSSSIAYSEEETEIGTFLGKKLYSKVFRTTESVTNANKEFTQTDASGIKNIISCTFCVEHTNYAWFIVGQCTIQNNHIYGRGLTGDSPTSGMYTNIVIQ